MHHSSSSALPHTARRGAVASEEAPAVDYERFNAALQHPWVAPLAAHLRQRNMDFSPAALAQQMGAIPTFPILSMAAFLRAVDEAGIRAKGVAIERDELAGMALPLLMFLSPSEGSGAKAVLVEIIRLEAAKVVVANDSFDEVSISRDEFERRWTGILLLVDGVRAEAARRGRAEREAFRSQIAVHDDFLRAELCRALIDYCESTIFQPSPIQQRRGGTMMPSIDTAFRSSFTAMLCDRNHPLLQNLYQRCAELEGLQSNLIEDIQCVRYRRGQRFRTHFDSSSEHPRRATYLLYLNEDFKGGETIFPQIDLRVEPRTGRCLRFPDCEFDGRTIWASEHGGLPVSEGTKYALNIWFRCLPK